MRFLTASLFVVMMGLGFAGCTAPSNGLNGMGGGVCNNPKCKCPKPCQCGAGCRCGMNGNSESMATEQQ
jgi:hypothetical protein